MANRLADSLSPYLLQHADNPVDWWEWGEEAFAEARRRDVPVLLSVGYAACHWCHVMAHESFEDDEVAALVNDRFVAVKVDREERPDVDAVYMAATTALTGHGGWPMTCLLTLDGEPFFAGTYLPKAQLLQLLGQADHLWRTDRERVVESGAHVASRLREVTTPPSPTTIDAAVCERAVRRLRAEHDDARGGFGGAPKFPPSSVLEFLLRHHARTGDADSLAMARATCAAMARGGMYDQLAGGFARYSVDAGWVVPHFEKMLYDNAQLLRVYLHLWRAHRRPAGPSRRRGDGGVPRARPADRGGGLRLGARRRHGRRRPLARGAHLRLDPRPARRGARRGRRAASGGPPRGDARGELRARLAPPSACCATPTTRRGGRRYAAGSSPPAAPGRSRPATTRS